MEQTQWKLEQEGILLYKNLCKSCHRKGTKSLEAFINLSGYT